MSMVLSLADFLAYLRQRDFNVGVNDLLRAQILIETIDQDYPSQELLDTLRQEHPSEEVLDALLKDYPPDKLKARLCPLFAVNQKEQLRFYEAFDDYINHVGRPPGPTSPPRPPVTPRRSWKKPVVALSILAATLVALFLWLDYRGKTEEDPAGGTGVAATATPSPAKAITPAQTGMPTSSPLGAVLHQTTPQTSPSPSPTPSPPPWEPPPGKAYVAVFLAALVLFILYELAGHLNRKRLLRKQEWKSPPFSWPLTVKAPKVKLYRSDQFFQAMRRLRRRRIAEYHRLNIPGTIAATIRSLGYPSFRYKPDSVIPEYLMLIDRTSFRDHQAHLFDELFKAFRREGLYITRFFYERDPSRCFDEEGKSFQHLSELRSKYFDHRLLILGDGEKLLDPVTGTLAEWVQIFSGWHDRAVLTPVAPPEWGFREAQLVREFSVLPATVDGLRELADSFAPPITRELGIWDYDEADVLPRNLIAENVVGELRPRLGEDVFQWLCACALYPELHWNLTLQIGSLRCMKPELVNEENLLRLARLPWFSAGTIPEDIRLSLTEALDPEKETAVRAIIIDLLAKDAPPSGTFAADTHSLELALQQWLSNRNAENLRRLRVAMKNMPANEILEDKVLVRYLRRVPASPLTRLLPRSLRQGLYKQGLPMFGFKTAAHFLVMLLIVLIISLGMRAGAVPVLYPRSTPTAAPSPGPSPKRGDGDDIKIPKGAEAFTVSPASAKRGSDFQLTIEIAKCDPASLRGAALEAPPGSGIEIDEVKINDCTLVAHITIPGSTALGPVEFSLRRGDSITPIPFTVTSVECPTITITGSRQAGDYRFTAVVQGGQVVSQPRFTWKAIGRDQQGSSSVDRDIPFTGQGTSSILIKQEEQDPGIYLMLDVTVTGYDASCKASASGGGFPDEPPPPSPAPTQTTTPGPTPQPGQCPSISVSCPDSVSEGEPITLTANVPIGAPSSLTYNWTISAGTIMGGQDGPSIKVDTSGLGGQVVTATVEIGGLSPSCARTTSCSSSVEASPKVSYKFDQYGNIGTDDEMARLDNLAVTLQNQPDATAHLIGYSRKEKPGEAVTRLNRAKSYLKARGIDPARVKIVDGGKRSELRIELWIVPKGAIPPSSSRRLSFFFDRLVSETLARGLLIVSHAHEIHRA